jgi:hypothetical protein
MVLTLFLFFFYFDFRPFSILLVNFPLFQTMSRAGYSPESFREHPYSNKVLTYIEYRAVSGVFRTTLLTPLSSQRVCPPPAPKAGGSHSQGGEGGGVNISEDARHWIGLLQYNPSTLIPIL